MSSRHHSQVAGVRAGSDPREIALDGLVRDADIVEMATRTGAKGRTAQTETGDMRRAIGAGGVDASAISDKQGGQQVLSLSTADRPYRTFVDNMRDGAVTVSAAGQILYANHRLGEMLSRPAGDVVGTPLVALLAGDHQLGLAALLGPHGHGMALELELRGSGGLQVPVLAGSSTLDVDGDKLICITFTDLSAHKAQEREIARLVHGQAKRLNDLQEAQAALTQQATHDTLTGLPNRALVVDRIEVALAHARRSGRGVGVLFLDLDGFKQVNDTRGHTAGDALLTAVARTLVAALRPMDTVARVGGDEFVILTPALESNLYAVELSARLLADLAIDAEDPDGVGASIGISVSGREPTTAETMVNEADAAMYQAKLLGGGRIEVFDEHLGRQLQQRAVARVMLESALTDDRVDVHYQPMVELAGGTIAGFEALVRITATDGSIVPPSAFVPVAEESGLVKALGARVLTAACEEAPTWRAPGRDHEPLTVAVNLSARQFESGDLTTIVRTTLDAAGLSPERVLLELTETAIMDLRPGILQQLAHLRELGVEIGLDDFGTGYASLTHLRRLPLTFVKIDRSFVAGLGTDREDDRIVSAVIDLAANLGLRSVAEGVETAYQLHRLRDLGCDQAQGYFFARPMPAAEVSAALGRGPW